MAAKKATCEWEELFKAADKDKSGSLDMKELKDLLRSGNSNLTDSQIADCFVYFDGPDGDKKISLDEFVKGLETIALFIQELIRLFKEFDADNSGFLDQNELKNILSASGHKFTDDEIQCILKEADKSGDGKISVEEFLNACT